MVVRSKLVSWAAAYLAASCAGVAGAQLDAVDGGQAADGGPVDAGSDSRLDADLDVVSITPPVLRSEIALEYPASEAVLARAASVLLRLDVDATGGVTSAEVVESQGPAFDAEARAAALRLRFSPALRGNEPTPARIQFRIEFVPPPRPVATQPSAADTAPAPVEVRVRATPTDAQRLSRSAEAVSVLETRRARQQAYDMADVLARIPGVTLRRSGGLGSDVQLSLEGFTGDQVRFFLDGIPVELAGYPFGLGMVPVNLVERIEVFRGGVPVRFGADALGGAINLVSREHAQSGAAASYEIGSFATHRLTAGLRYRDDANGFFAHAAGFFDSSDNDYDVDVDVPDDDGSLRPARVRRFHDGYQAYGVSADLGVADRSWAKKLMLRVFQTEAEKEIQHNIVMTVPYGEVESAGTTRGAALRYRNDWSNTLELELIAGYAYWKAAFHDRAKWVYDWYGERVRERTVPGERLPGEIEGLAVDERTSQHGGLGRALVSWAPAEGHALRASLAPQYVRRSGDDQLSSDTDEREPSSAVRTLATLASGIEYELNAFRGPGDTADTADVARSSALQNILFVKDYVYRAAGEESLGVGEFRDVEQNDHRLGVGDSARLELLPGFYLKASYEYATRFPQPEEIFGDGVLVRANLRLRPESSHNGNLGFRLEQRGSLGELNVELNGFVREARDLIVLQAGNRYSRHANVYAARTFGVETTLASSLVRRLITVDAGATLQDQRNVSDEGEFAAFRGDRIPNRPWLMANWGTTLRFANLFQRSDALEPYYNGRYVNEFFRGWESQGARELKQTVEAQVVHGLGLTYSTTAAPAKLSASVECHNLANARTFDLFGVQKPGRAFYFKLTGEI